MPTTGRPVPAAAVVQGPEDRSLLRNSPVREPGDQRRAVRTAAARCGSAGATCQVLAGPSIPAAGSGWQPETRGTRRDSATRTRASGGAAGPEQGEQVVGAAHQDEGLLPRDVGLAAGVAHQQLHAPASARQLEPAAGVDAVERCLHATLLSGAEGGEHTGEREGGAEHERAWFEARGRARRGIGRQGLALPERDAGDDDDGGQDDESRPPSWWRRRPLRRPGHRGR